MGPEALAHVLRPLAELFPAAAHPDVLAGIDGADDAAVLRLSADQAIVATTDFFTPIVDDPYAYGAIAAANAMSDVFAMGGEVLMALNLVAFPEDLSPEEVAEIIRGGAETVRAAGGVLAGGHSVVDPEPKYGLVVIGRADPDRLLLKAGAQPGDTLVLTKPLGTGLISTAIKQDAAPDEQIRRATEMMTRLNQVAGGAAVRIGAHAATDITGFGLAGHALEMAERSEVTLRFDLGALPLLDGAWDHALAGRAPGGTWRNRDAAANRVVGLEQAAARRGDAAEHWEAIVFDPQTSGGLLVALDPGDVPAFREALVTAGESEPVVIGRVEPIEDGAPVVAFR